MTTTTLIDPAVQEILDSYRNPMSREEREAFLAQPHVSVMSISREGRGPLSVPMWYGYESGGDIWIITERDSLKGRSLRDGTLVTFLMTSDFLSRVSVEGPVVSLREPTIEDLLRVCHRYLDKAPGDEYAKHLEPILPYSVLATVRPERWSSNVLTGP